VIFGKGYDDLTNSRINNLNATFRPDDESCEQLAFCRRARDHASDLAHTLRQRCRAHPGWRRRPDRIDREAPIPLTFTEAGQPVTPTT
jgi:hypothetical protein